MISFSMLPALLQAVRDCLDTDVVAVRTVLNTLVRLFVHHHTFLRDSSRAFFQQQACRQVGEC